MLTEKRKNASSSSITCFGLLRHGTTVWNEEKRIQGSMDSKLSSAGKKKMQDWARYLRSRHWNRILTSSLGRARESTSIINSVLGIPVVPEPRLREQHWGEWEGQRIEEIRIRDSREIERQIAAGWNFRPPRGESRQEVLQRSQAALRDAALTWPQQKILVICHQGVIKCLIFDILKKDFLPEDSSIQLNQNALHLITFSKDSLFCRELNISPPCLL